tara:strand:+ start:443 stop:571 length:129 start_codon:yes stop_codon:yes gene_type:complete
VNALKAATEKESNKIKKTVLFSNFMLSPRNAHKPIDNNIMIV